MSEKNHGEQPSVPTPGPLPADILGESVLFERARAGLGFADILEGRKPGDPHIRRALTEQGGGGVSALWIAADSGNTAFLSDALSFDQDALMVPGYRSELPVHAAARRQDPAALALCRPAKSFRKGNDRGFTALHEAAQNSPACLSLLLAIPAAKRLVKSGKPANKWGSTPLLSAARAGMDVAVSMLVAAGADPNQCSSGGNSALCMAAGHPSTADLLVSLGADPAHTPASGHGVAWCAAREGNAKLLALSLESGADPFVTASGISPAAQTALHGPADLLAMILDRASPVGNEADSVFQRAVSSPMEPEAKIRLLVSRGIRPRDIAGKAVPDPASSNSHDIVVSSSDDCFERSWRHDDKFSTDAKSPLPLCARRGFSKSLRTLLALSREGAVSFSPQTLVRTWFESLSGSPIRDVALVEAECSRVLGAAPRGDIPIPAVFKTDDRSRIGAMETALTLMAKRPALARLVAGSDRGLVERMGAFLALNPTRPGRWGPSGHNFSSPGPNILWEAPAFLRLVAQDPGHRLFPALSSPPFPWRRNFCILCVRALSFRPDTTVPAGILEASGIPTMISLQSRTKPFAKKFLTELHMESGRGGRASDNDAALFAELSGQVAMACAESANHSLARSLCDMGADPSAGRAGPFWKALLYSRPDKRTPRSARTWRLQKTAEAILPMPGAAQALRDTGLAGMCEDAWTMSLIAESFEKLKPSDPDAQPMALAVQRLGSGRVTPSILAHAIAMSSPGAMASMHPWESQGVDDRKPRTVMSTASLSLSLRQGAARDFPGWKCFDILAASCDLSMGDSPRGCAVSDAIANGNRMAALRLIDRFNPPERPWLAAASIANPDALRRREGGSGQSLVISCSEALSERGRDPWAALPDGSDPFFGMICAERPDRRDIVDSILAGHPATRAYPFETISGLFPFVARRILLANQSEDGRSVVSAGAAALCLASRLDERGCEEVFRALAEKCPDDSFRSILMSDGSRIDAAQICRHDAMAAMLEDDFLRRSISAPTPACAVSSI